jgi:hypothetical protein
MRRLIGRLGTKNLVYLLGNPHPSMFVSAYSLVLVWIIKKFDITLTN